MKRVAPTLGFPIRKPRFPQAGFSLWTLSNVSTVVRPMALPDSRKPADESESCGLLMCARPIGASA
jgi:hypothetical protein